MIIVAFVVDPSIEYIIFVSIKPSHLYIIVVTNERDIVRVIFTSLLHSHRLQIPFPDDSTIFLALSTEFIQLCRILRDSHLKFIVWTFFLLFVYCCFARVYDSFAFHVVRRQMWMWHTIVVTINRKVVDTDTTQINESKRENIIQKQWFENVARL